jgi:hypothetical protein
VKGYSYTTISMQSGRSPYLNVTIYPDAHARVRYCPAENGKSSCHVSIQHGDAMVAVGLTSDATVTPAQVDFARELFNAAAAFLADCERLAVAHAADQNPGQHSGTTCGQAPEQAGDRADDEAA